MDISAITSTPWYAGTSASAARAASAAAAQGAVDSASFSPEALAALAGQGGPPPLTAEVAAEFGARLQEDDPELFAQMDGDGDGTLTAAEMEEGKPIFDAAMQQRGAPPPPPPPSSEDAGLGQEQVEELLQLLREQGWDDEQLSQLADALAQISSSGA